MTAPPAATERRAPVILVATANEAEGARHLRSLELELRDIVAALDSAQRGGICEIVTLPDATPEQVVRTFQDDAYRDRIGVLHFAGHAGPEGLLFETADGSTAVADAGGLAAFLGCQRGLQLVVLNACATQAHVDSLRDAGVGSVIATSKTVEDEIAHQFAVLLYQGLGSGAGIKRAYDEAAAGVRFKHGATARGSTVDSMHASAEVASKPAEAIATTSRDISRKKSVTTDDGRWPWDLYFRRGAEESVAPWALPEAAGNPLFGLPALPETAQPLTEPFRHLRPFTRAHAELFFGRGKDIRELYDKVTSAASEPVVLLYGATGVGKSSLLDAGLLPRLTSTHEVRYAPRNRPLGLLGTLAQALDVADPATADRVAVAQAWRTLEAKCGRPLFVVIDQLEEAYTAEDAGRVAAGAGTQELDAFAHAIATLFSSQTERPRGRLVLGFRKEWLSEVKAALEAHRVARTEHRLEQLTRGGVLEA
ncbi:MAG TPA: CHAT domain-containing protein, partial [Gemmatimonadaceae bacterium]|nr:CHAT domain-containing protein [Gemmatimonadaceae bacterium]